jgi:hypothetical protein
LDAEFRVKDSGCMIHGAGFLLLMMKTGCPQPVNGDLKATSKIRRIGNENDVGSLAYGLHPE